MLYSAVATTDVKLFKISVADFQSKIPSEIHKLLEGKALEKLDWIRTRFEQCHNTRKKIAALDIRNQCF
jgi:hypothetical protein